MKSFKQFFLEYRHFDAMGFSKASGQAHNGKNPNIVTPDKHLGTDGPYTLENPRLKIMGGTLTPQELADLDIYDYTPGKVYENVKNSGSTVMIITTQGKPVGKVVSIEPKREIKTPHLTMTK